MLGVTFYHQTIRKYVAVFGTLFNDISIERKNSSGTVIEKLKIPLAYGPKQKWLWQYKNLLQHGKFHQLEFQEWDLLLQDLLMILVES